MLDILLRLAAFNGLLAIPLMLLWRQDFAANGRVSNNGAILSGIVMHGHALITFAVAWIDQGTLGMVSPVINYAGGALVLAGAFIIFAGRYAYGSRARVYGLMEDRLIRHGIYSWTRNPQYFGYWMMFMGAALAAMSVWALVLAMTFAAFVHIHITGVEEPHLKRTFGDDYRAYCTQTARYFGHRQI